MRSLWGNVRVVHDKYGRYIIGYIPKKRTRKTPYPEHIIRINPLPREKAAIIKLRRLGHRINHIAKFLGRSTSYVYRVITTAQKRGILTHFDMRKMPNQMRRIASAQRWTTMLKLWQQWEAWILGEGDKPP